ncbi:hypothetical protein Lal_00021891 [Lupinus albus]|nr:hypothetical protein Lal_00021891 [Lupinus albus]
MCLGLVGFSLKRAHSRSSEKIPPILKKTQICPSRLDEDPLAQARILQPRQVQNATFLAQARQLSLRRDHSRSSEGTLAQARILQYSPRFYPPKKIYVYTLQPLFQVRSRNTIKKEIFKVYDFERECAMKMLDSHEGRVAITSDMYIYVPTPHTSDIFSHALVECFMDWNIDTKI